MNDIFSNYINPTIIEERKLNVASMDVFSRLLMDRIIFIGTEINSDVSNIINAQLLWLDSINHNEITIYINSPGGSVYAGLSIFDTMHIIESPIKTVCIGMAASMASILLTAGDKRYALPHSRVMIHQPLGGVKGQASDIVITANEITKLKDELNQILATKTGQPLDKIYNDTDRDYYMTAQEAKEYGIIDEVIK
jgi:ATP-dependent Clp protease protease subunit